MRAAILPVIAIAVYLCWWAWLLQPDRKPIPPVTDYEKLRLEQNAQRKIMESILVYVRPDDEFAKQFAKTLEGSGIPRLPGVKE